tara:strand:- start:261 stop:1802 length:1542 start_codon:yes stop_codon:yes gene_type:complete
MNLENVTAEMRPRSEWEAVDLGARMIRRDAAAIYATWFAITLPILLVAIALTLFTPYATLAAFLYWWLEPIADGPILRIISRRLFGEEADARAAIRAAPALAWRNKLFLLTPYRFHFARSVAMPVTQLEGLRGHERKTRSKVLNLKIFNYGTGVTMAYQHLVLSICLGILLLVFAMVPTAYQDTLGVAWFDAVSNESSRASNVLSLVVFYIAQSVLQPWFVGAGFGLYINCRTQLEAWDIEVAFRRTVQRRAGQLAASSALAIVLALSALMPAASRAQDTDSEDVQEAAVPGSRIDGYWAAEDVDPAVERVYEDPLLDTERTVEEWQRLDRPEPDVDEPVGNSIWFDWLNRLGRTVSVIIEFGLWIFIAFLLFLVFALRDRWLPYLGFGHSKRRSAARVFIGGEEVTAASLPDDVSGEALRLWQSGDKRAALSLLYRGSVFAAVTQHGVRLPPSATEGDCLDAVVRHATDAQSEFFRRIVRAWVACAYGFRAPPDQVVLPLCAEWSSHYGKDE